MLRVIHEDGAFVCNHKHAGTALRMSSLLVAAYTEPCGLPTINTLGMVNSDNLEVKCFWIRPFRLKIGCKPN